MGFYALYRLLSWKSGTFLVFYVSFVVCFVLFFYADGPFPGMPRSGRLNFFTLLVSAFIGYFIGGVVAGVRRCWFSWTLPNLGRQVFSAVLFTGIAIAFLVAWIYKWLGGPAPWLPISTFNLLWYSMGMAYGWYFWGMFGTLKNDVRQSLIRNNRRFALMIFILLGLILAGFLINRIAEFCNDRPILCVIVTMLGAWPFVHRVFGSHAAKEISLFPALDYGVTTGGFSAKPSMSLTVVIGREWQHRRPISGLFNWIRAGAYENLGLVRGGWPLVAVGLSSMAVLLVAALAYYKGYERESHEMGVLYIYHAIFNPSTKKNMTVLVSIFPAMFVCMHAMLGSLLLKSNLLYPLARRQLARLAYWGSFLQNAVFCGVMLLTFQLAGSLVWFYTGSETPIKYVPDFIRPLILMFIFSPFLWWMHIRFGLRLISFGVAFAFTFGVGLLGILWLEEGSGISSIYEILGCVTMIFLSQVLFRYKIERYYKTADLV